MGGFGWFGERNMDRGLLRGVSQDQIRVFSLRLRELRFTISSSELLSLGMSPPPPHTHTLAASHVPRQTEMPALTPNAVQGHWAGTSPEMPASSQCYSSFMSAFRLALLLVGGVLGWPWERGKSLTPESQGSARNAKVPFPTLAYILTSE